MINRQNTTFNINQLQRNWESDTSSYNMLDSKFAIGFKFSDFDDDTSISYDESYFNVEFKTVSIRRNDPSGDVISENETFIDLSPCNQTFAPFVGPLINTVLNLNSYLCPTTLNFNLAGNLISKEYDFFTYEITKCQAHEYCKSDSEIETAMERLRVQLVFTNYYFDSKEYDSPIKISRQNDYFFSLLPGLFQEKILKIQANEAEDWTSYIQSLFSTNYEYLQAGHIKEDLRVQEEATVFSLNFELDENYINIERRAYTFLDVLGQVGGFMGFLIPTFGFVIAILSDKVYWTTLLHTFYDIEILDETKPTRKVQPVGNNLANKSTNLNDIYDRQNEFNRESAREMTKDDNKYQDSSALNFNRSDINF